MFTRILFPTDLTPQIARAVGTAVEIARKYNAPVELVHVIELVRGTSFDEMKDFYQEIEQSSRAKLEQLASQFEQHGVQVQSHILYGSRVRELVRFCEEKKIDLIVLQSQQLDPREPYEGWGSISFKLSVLAPCAVLLVR